ncbi:MAG: hypothetical protein COA47_05425 [Robiginitomaculum sp.]|nr:MAG: hypothetical protein COA47_05425 [Robiginitomaculum sp.]
MGLVSMGRIVIILTASVFLIACGDQPDPVGEQEVPTQQTTQKEMVTVTVVRPLLSDVTQTVIATGTLGPKQSSNIGPLVPGVITRIFVKVGDRVKKGDRLFQTRPDEYQRRVDEAKARLAVARAREANAQSNFDRSRILVEKGHNSQAQLDNVRTTLDVSKAESQLRGAELRTAKQNLTDTLVRAPYDAAITRRYNDEGVYLSTGSRTGPESTLLQLQENHIVVAVVRVPESSLNKLFVNMEAKVYIAGQAGPRTANVYAINDMVDIASRTVELRLGLDNYDFSIKTGQFVRAELIIGTKPSLTLPKTTVFADEKGKFVWVLNGSIVRKTPVEVQDEGQANILVLTGVTASDQIVLVKDHILTDGDRVQVGAN